MKNQEKYAQTFSAKLKEEIAFSFTNKSENELKYLLMAYIRQNGSLNLIQNKLGINLQITHPLVARKIYQTVKQIYQVSIDIIIRKQKRLNKLTLYILKITHPNKQFLVDIGFFSKSQFDFSLSEEVITNQMLFSSYLQGLFLASGSINNPQLSHYHLEISFNDEFHAENVQRIGEKIGLHFKIVNRRQMVVLYLKDSTQIADFLAFIQAFNCLFEFEDIRITRDFRNSFNRINNCEIANEQKAQKAIQRQLQAIEKLQLLKKWDGLSEKEQKVAMARVAYREATLSELSDILEKKIHLQISKSGLNHIFRKFYKLVEDGEVK